MKSFLIRIVLLQAVFACMMPELLAGPGSSESGAIVSEATGEGAVELSSLKCEYLVNPLGIDVVRPRLSWIIESDQRGQKQSAYRILVADSKEVLSRNKGNIWDSGRVESDQSIHVVYQGKPLKSHMRCYWKVRIWEKDGRVCGWSEPAMWTMGLLASSDWKAKWIGLDGPEQALQSEHTRLPARMLRRQFEVAKKVKRATAYVCGLGFFELYLNGQKLGDHIMDPGLTECTKRLLYVTFDVTSQLRQGVNAVGVILGNGRYFSPRKSPYIYGFPKLLFQMRIEYEDGTAWQLISDRSWKMSDNGPIRANNEFDGEEYDARMEQDGWSKAGFDDSGWQGVQLVKEPGGVLQAQMVEPMRITQVIRPVAITNPKPGMYVVDMGQAFYGMVRVKVSGPAGTKIQMRSAYSLKPDGLLKSEDNRSARSADVYILKGKGTELWHPRFRGQGYRFVEVTGFAGVPGLDNFEGLVVHTDFESTGSFSCSDTLINKIYNNIRWGQRSFKRSVPMEPDRDERQGWLGDPAKDSESDAYNFNVAPFYTKWLGDIRFDQRPDGHLPDVSPTYWPYYNCSIVWPSVITIIPECFYNFYGDRRILEDNYETMKKWMLFLERIRLDDFTMDHNRWGDWCDTSTMGGVGNPYGATFRPLLSTAYYYNNCRIMVRVAGLLGRREDAAYFSDLAGKVKTAFNSQFFNPKTNKYKSQTQCSYVLPLAFDLVPEESRSAVIANLVDDIMVRHKGHLSVGLVGMQWLMQVLTDVGHPEVAYTIATQTTRPSWGYMVSKGATTIWERWDADTQGPGMNSEALLILAGNLEAWFYQSLAGINYDANQPGFKHIILRPFPVGGLQFVRASYKSMYGKIVSNWKIKGDKFSWDVVVPPNTTATVYVPAVHLDSVTESGKAAKKSRGVRFLRMKDGRAVFAVESGKYKFVSKLSR